MGNLQTLNVEQYDQGPHSDIKISIDYKRSVSLQLQPLLHWSLQEIRQIYVPFRQRKGSPLLSRSEFLRFLRLSRIMSFHLFDTMCIQHSLNVFEIISILVLTAYTSYSYKIQFLFNIFDLDSSRGLQFKQLILSFKSLIRGYCILTNQQLPENDLLQKYGQIMFSRADLNNDQCLQLGEVLSWFQGNVEGIYLFKRFQPSDTIGKEEYYIFNSYIAYSDQQIRLIYQRIQKQYKKINLSSEDFELLKLAKPIIKRAQSKNYTEQLSKSKRHQRTQSNFKPKTKTSYIQSLEQLDKQKKVGFNVLTKRSSGQAFQRFVPKLSRQESVMDRINLNLDKQNKQFEGNQLNSTKNGLKKTSCLNSSNRFESSILNSSRQNKNLKQLNNFLDKTGFKTVRNLKNSCLNSWEATTLNLSHVKLIKQKIQRKKFQNIIILVIIDFINRKAGPQLKKKFFTFETISKVCQEEKKQF